MTNTIAAIIIHANLTLDSFSSVSHANLIRARKNNRRNFTAAAASVERPDSQRKCCPTGASTRTRHSPSMKLVLSATTLPSSGLLMATVFVACVPQGSMILRAGNDSSSRRHC
jgi:hypothetical protein